MHQHRWRKNRKISFTNCLSIVWCIASERRHARSAINTIQAEPATLAMSKFVQELKVSTSKWLKANVHFPLFEGWTKEYAGFSYNLRDKDMIVGYIAKQKEHHRHVTFAEEYRQFLVENGVEIKEEYFLQD